MPVTIPYEQLKEIATEPDVGMKCFYHIPTSQIKSYPDELKGHAGFDEEPWQDIINKWIRTARSISLLKEWNRMNLSG